MKDQDHFLVKTVFNNAVTQYERSLARSAALEVVAIVLGVLHIVGVVFAASLGVTQDDDSYFWIALATAVVGALSYLSVSTFSHLLGNSSHHLLISAYQMFADLEDDFDEDQVDH